MSLNWVSVQRGQDHFGRELHGQADALVGFCQSWVEITDLKVVTTSGKTHHPIVHPTGIASDHVPGTVFEITADELAAADKYEVDDYRRVSAELQSGLIAWGLR